MSLSSDQQPAPGHEPVNPNRKFHLWRLLGVIAIVVIVLAGASALIDTIALSDLGS